MTTPNHTTKQQKKSLVEQSVDILLEDGYFFSDLLNNSYYAVYGESVVYNLDDPSFKSYFAFSSNEKLGKILLENALNQSLWYLRSIAKRTTIPYAIRKRVNIVNNIIFYDFANTDILQISKNKISFLAKKGEPLFCRSSTMVEQIKPNFQVDLSRLYELLKKHFRLKNSHDYILLLVNIVISFIPNVQHPILCLSGEKGSGKTLSMDLLRKVIDPSIINREIFPSKDSELSLILSNSYAVSFDNLDERSITSSTSNLLCSAVSNAAQRSRRLFSDNETVTRHYSNFIMVNGIGELADKSDLLDRVMLIEFERIPTSERRSENVLIQEFNKDLPDILGSIFQLLQCILNDDESSENFKLTRFTDFDAYASKICKYINYSLEDYVNILKRMQARINSSSIQSNDAASTLLKYIEVNQLDEINMTVGELFVSLQLVAFTYNYTRFPKQANWLSNNLNKAKSNLAEIGITFEIKHTASSKIISIDCGQYIENWNKKR